MAPSGWQGCLVLCMVVWGQEAELLALGTRVSRDSQLHISPLQNLSNQAHKASWASFPASHSCHCGMESIFCPNCTKWSSPWVLSRYTASSGRFFMYVICVSSLPVTAVRCGQMNVFLVPMALPTLIPHLPGRCPLLGESTPRASEVRKGRRWVTFIRISVCFPLCCRQHRAPCNRHLLSPNQLHFVLFYCHMQGWHPDWQKLLPSEEEQEMPDKGNCTLLNLRSLLFIKNEIIFLFVGLLLFIKEEIILISLGTERWAWITESQGSESLVLSKE